MSDIDPLPPGMDVVIGHAITQQIAFIGPFGVGKTTALRAISDTPVASMDVPSSELDARMREEGKSTTTVGFDYGEWISDDGERIGLYGVPGQARFEAIWNRILPMSSAVVLWVHADREDGLADTRFWLDTLARHQALNRMALALTRIPPDDEARIAPYRDLLQQYHRYAPVLTADPRERDDVLQTVMVALCSPPPH